MYDTVAVPILIPCSTDKATRGRIPPASEAVGLATFLSGERGKIPVRPLRDQDLGSKETRYWLERTGYASAFQPLLKLGQAITEHAVTERFPELHALIQAKKDVELPHRTLSQRLSRLLDGVQIVLWWDGARFLPALYCAGGVVEAILVRLLLTIAAGEKGLGLRVCPHCSKLFLQARPDQSYCSVPCREAHRLARYRERQKKPRKATRKRR